ncbi:hypothetical protein [Marinobacter orientalis]|uniref:Uncharacterized protein n=1 Tax=Marinobacter orientalis TaxID=1928859 RepID=A0A7Y0RC17_9GAMM|nr:hypothetical protein [Marinobacter orientalis]NMT63468.1 hypothetical protein [Marinobacter orientalis]TGX48529.1 hypothetical protein DIT72_14140 [Marinobacter orientalis]
MRQKPRILKLVNSRADEKRHALLKEDSTDLALKHRNNGRQYPFVPPNVGEQELYQLALEQRRWLEQNEAESVGNDLLSLMEAVEAFSEIGEDAFKAFEVPKRIKPPLH